MQHPIVITASCAHQLACSYPPCSADATSSFLAQCRPLSDSMGNAIKYLKHEITHGVVPGTPEEEAKAVLADRIDKFIQVGRCWR